jgi:acyl carrier protein
MDSVQVMKEINKIFVNVLDNESIVLTRETTAADVEDWDSLNHIQLIVAIEKHYKLKFTSQEIRSWKDVGAMCDSLSKALSA